MDRLFLDANVLFSAAYRADAGLLDLWKLKNVRLCTSYHALEEARVNLAEPAQIGRLDKLALAMELFETPLQELPDQISLPEKDVPIMLGAISARAAHLVTGDTRHFGPYFGKEISGVLIILPRDYLRKHGKR